MRTDERDAKMAYALALQPVNTVVFTLLINLTEKDSQLAFVGMAVVVFLGCLASFMLVVVMIGYAFPLSRGSVIVSVVHILLFLILSFVLREIGIERLLSH